MEKTLIEHFKREEERAGKRAGGEEDYDEGVEEQLVDEDDEDVYILSKVGLIRREREQNPGLLPLAGNGNVESKTLQTRIDIQH